MTVSLFTSEVNKYYIHNAIRKLAHAKGGYFVMAYFFFHGFTVSQIILNILVFSVSTLLFLYPINWLIGKIGIKRTFALHIIPTIISFFIVISVSRMPLLFYVWMVVHALSVVLRRLPLNAHFSHHGENIVRGKQLSLNKNIEILVGLIVPITLGWLLDSGGLVVLMGLKTAVFVVAGFALGFKENQRFRLEMRPRQLFRKVPVRFTKAYFLSSLPYPFANDLFFIWIAVTFGTFAAAGTIVALQATMALLLSWTIGSLTDNQNVRRAFAAAIILGSAVWLMLPFAEGIRMLTILQLLAGFALLSVEIPAEREYHNSAKDAKEEVVYSTWREMCTSAGMIAGSIAALVLVSFIDWKILIPVGALSILPFLYLIPKEISA